VSEPPPLDLDRQLVDGIARATLRGRALLCALARRGKLVARDEPLRAGALLAASQASPLYKGARLLFDLLELDDLMLDGPPPPPLAGEDLGASFGELSAAFAAFARALEAIPLEPSPPAEPAADAPERERPAEPGPERELPEIDAADYLYDLVVLGVLQGMRRPRSQAATERETTEPPAAGNDGAA